MKYRKKPVVIEASQWFRIGDHAAVLNYHEAPEIMAAGSTVRDEFGPEIDDWLVMPSMVDRLPPNA